MIRTEMSRGTKGLKRTPFKAKQKPVEAKQKTPAPRSTLKTRQRTRTPAEIELHDRLAALGCIACLKDGRFNDYVSIHHVDGRTKEGCHLLVLPLCAPHHQRDDTDPLHRISVHGDKARFEKRYGQQLALVAECMTLLEGRK
ncbi:MAG: Ref family recombination enhancement nuclease [Pseudomonadota bacterium]